MHTFLLPVKLYSWPFCQWWWWCKWWKWWRLELLQKTFFCWNITFWKWFCFRISARNLNIGVSMICTWWKEFCCWQNIICRIKHFPPQKSKYKIQDAFSMINNRYHNNLCYHDHDDDQLFETLMNRSRVVSTPTIEQDGFYQLQRLM